jgi:hypothetical protein
LPTSRARTGGDGETPSRAGTGPRARLAGCAARVRAAPRRVPNRGGAHSGPTRHPLLRSRKGGNYIRRTLHFSHFARGGVGAGALSGVAGARTPWPSTVDAPFRFRASGEHVPYGLVLFLRVEGRGRHDVTDRAKRRDARPEFSRVRSDSLPAGQPSRVRWGPSAPPLQELRATGRGPSRERADAVRGRTLRRPRFPATMRRRKSVGQRSSADRSLCATVLESHKGTFYRFSILVKIPFGTHFPMSKRNASRRKEQSWVFLATLAGAVTDEQEADPAQEEREGA